MKKNVAGQKIGAQMITAADGSAFTGAVTVYVCGDAGAQNIGSVGGGACTHEGNGYHTYAPADSETNYNLIAFTFIGAGAVPATVQVFTTYPQTGDAYAVVSDGTYGNSALKTLLDAIAAYVDTEIGDIITAIAALNDVSAADVATAIGGRIAEAQGNYTYDQILRIILSVLAGVTETAGATFKTPNGAATRVAATVNGSNERTAMTLTP